MLVERTVAILDVLRASGLEPDQRLLQAIVQASSRNVSDFHIFLALYRLNCIATRKLSPRVAQQIESAGRWGWSWTGFGWGDWHRHSLLRCDYRDIDIERVPVEDAEPVRQTNTILLGAVAKSIDQKTLGCRDYLLSLLEQCEKTGDNYDERPWTLDVLIANAGYPSETPLSEVPGVLDLIRTLGASTVRDEDFQYLLGLADGRLVFRVASILDDYVQESASRVLTPRRAVLTHFKDQFGGFTSDEIEELEELLNNEAAREFEFQTFFERHTHFLRRWDHREVFPRLMLGRREGSLIPDFLLTDRALQRAAVLDLKLPSPRLVTRRSNRDRFSSAVIEARAQLLRYRDWFRDAHNRKSLVAKVGMEVYEPHLIVVVGRQSDFEDEVDRQRLAADNPDIEVVTYDDILAHANRRRIVINS